MDNFLDKIAQKLNSQEVIKANAAAEVSEMKHLKLKVSEYEKILQEIRQVNLHSAELAQQMQDTLRLIRQAGAHSGQAGNTGVSEETVRRIQDGLEQIQRTVADSVQKQPASSALTDELNQQIVELLRAKTDTPDQLTEGTQHLIEMSNEIAMWLQQANARTSEIVERLQRAGEHSEETFIHLQTASARNVEIIDQLQTASDRNVEIVGQLKQANLNNLKVAEKIQQAADRADEAVTRLEAVATHDAENLSGLRGMTERSVQAVTGVQTQMAEVLGAVKGISAANSDMPLLFSQLEDQVKEILEGNKAGLQEMFSATEEYVHRENVKVYRNVQAVVEEGFRQQGEEASRRGDCLAAQIKGTKMMVVIALLLSAAAAVLSVLPLAGF